MISIRRCSRCHRYFDAYSTSHKTICQLCEYGEAFLGEFDDDAVYSPDIREPSEEPYKQDLKTKRKLWKLCESDFGLLRDNYTNDEDDSDDPLTNDCVIEVEQNAEPFIPLLYPDSGLMEEGGMNDQDSARLTKNRPSINAEAKFNCADSTPPRITLKRRNNPYIDD